MEETLGKRIVANRKRMGMTQDQLAERLGITAQAVSKWENDQSCPDITMLPRLAEIFGVSTDALLGISGQKTVHTAEVVEDDDHPGIHFENQDNHWELKWDSGRKHSLAFALWILLTGGLLLASKLLNWEAGFWDILWPSALLVFGLSGLFPKFSFFRVGCVLLGGYFLLSNLNITTFVLGWELLLPVCLLLFGLSLLFDAVRKPKSPHIQVLHNGKPVHRGAMKGTAYTEDAEAGTFSCSTSFGENDYRVLLPNLAGGQASVSFGELTLDLTGCGQIASHCSIDASCSFGELKILVPHSCRVEHTASTAFAAVSLSGTPDPDAASIIDLDCSANFGEISIRYI